MILEILVWLLFGALAGWIASMIMSTNEEQGAIGNIVVGLVGALIGGMVVNLFGAQGVTGFNFWSLFVAIMGAVILLSVVNLFRRGANHGRNG